MTKAQRRSINLSFTVFVFLFAVSEMSPQTSAQNSNHGQIAGVVLDLNGRAVSNAIVTMANSQIGYSNSVNTSQDGSFGFINIPLARYELAASAPGFAVTRAALTVRGGAMPPARLLLQPAQQSGTATLSGTVTLGESGKAVHGVTVTILQLRRTAVTDDNGKYQFQDVPTGKYDVVAHLDRVPDMVKSVDLTTGAATVDFQVQLSGVREEVTVTATGTEQAVSSSIQSVEVIGSVDLAKKSPVSLGESLDGELGVSKRSFGPGTARPVIRGFDGDRVLVLQDGNRIGGLGFESGDHAEPVSVLTVDRIEVVKGPATLLYGSSAIGGVVNAISRHDSAHKGVNGYLTGVGATNRGQLSGSAGLEYGTDKWMIWGNAGGQTSDDYNTPLRRVANSFSRERSASAGAGYYPEKGFFSFNYNWDQRRYGIPYDPDEVDPEIVFLNPRRHSFEFKGGFRDSKSFLNAGTFSVQYNDYTHSEIKLETREVGTAFKNKTLVYQGIFDQQKRGKLSGRFGVWGSHRDFEASGEEALAPPTTQNAFAVFALETLDFKKASIQFGGRVETNRYKPTATPARGVLPDRTFTGFSGAIGLRVPTWKGGAFVANYSHSYRAPALEELYNEGPHPGNLAFEIGNPNLTREQGDAIDFGLRHSSKRFRVEANSFYYRLSDFIFLAPTGATDPDSGLVIADYLQGKSRFFGSEAQASVALHPRIWLNVAADYVNAELTGPGTPLPRIPPLRGRVGLELRVKGLLVNPEFVMANHQDRVFSTETSTAGYGVFGISGSYMFAGQHHAQIISFNAFNLGDRLYRNHLSFIKGFAPEIGRGVRVTYTFRFF